MPHHNSFRNLHKLVIMLMIASLFSAAFFVRSDNASADTGTATVNATVTGGALTIGVVAFSPYLITLGGADQTVNSSFIVPVVDARGLSTAGWKLQAYISGPLTSITTSEDTIPAATHKITSAGTTVSVGTPPTSNSTRFSTPAQIPVGSTSPLLIFSNAAGAGMGTSTESFGTSLFVPVSTVAHADYAATLTVSLVSGP